MIEYVLESAVRQNWTSKFKIYTNGLGVIENTHHKTKKTTSVFLNAKTTEKIHNSLFLDRTVTITPANKITALLTKLGLVKMDINYNYKKRTEK